MRTCLFAILLLAGISSCCTKNFEAEVEPLNSNSYYQCNQSLDLDSVAVIARLIGSWKPQKSYNIWTDETTIIRSTAVTTFDTDSTYTFTNDKGEVIKGSWGVTSYGIKSWIIKANPSLDDMWGPMLFCDNEVVFYTSPMDGPDVLYQKVP